MMRIDEMIGKYRNELEKLKDIPRQFDEELFRYLGVSETVIRYWQDIGFNPGYFQRFWLLQMNKRNMLYGEYAKVFDSLLENVIEENRVIGEALKEYREMEKSAVDRFYEDDSDHIYKLSYYFDDGSGGMELMSTDHEKIFSRMKKKARNKSLEFCIEKYEINREDGDTEISELVGRHSFNNARELKYYEIFKGFFHEEQYNQELLFPYIWMPHPFHDNDLVQTTHHGEKIAGIILGISRENEQEEYRKRGLEPEGEDVSATVEYVVGLDSGGCSFVHTHVCPYRLDNFIPEEFGQERYILKMAKMLVTEGRSDFETFMSLMHGAEIKF